MMQDRCGDNPQKSANYDENVAHTQDKARLKASLDRPIVLIGMMGVGKTRLGRLLAERLELGFCDSDAVIEESQGGTIAAYFAKNGEPAFRDLEYKTFDTLLDGTPKVIGAGGGVVVNPQSRAILRDRAYVIWLQADIGELVKRCAGSTARPLLNSGDPQTILTNLLEKRASLYAETAAFTVRTDTQSIDATINALINGLDQCLKT